MFRDLEKAQTAFTGIAAHRLTGVSLSIQNEPMTGEAMMVSGSYFPVLGLSAAKGRLLVPEDDKVIGANLRDRRQLPASGRRSSERTPTSWASRSSSTASSSRSSAWRRRNSTERPSGPGRISSCRSRCAARSRPSPSGKIVATTGSTCSPASSREWTSRPPPPARTLSTAPSSTRSRRRSRRR